ncbi:unnamed protein product [Clavelina lepadiformis]|uniref:Uncharacterized protein n=1 Tax=Clavelina lepadiformis TaxID=159417 RepID=A0ABP0FFM7_CLALP
MACMHDVMLACNSNMIGHNHLLSFRRLDKTSFVDNFPLKCCCEKTKKCSELCETEILILALVRVRSWDVGGSSSVTFSNVSFLLDAVALIVIYRWFDQSYVDRVPGDYAPASL